MPEWSAEIVVDERLARRLLDAQFPELEHPTLRLLGEGWDNTAWLVDDQWVFRFPRRAIALPGFERELAVLPALAPQLPLPVPTPAVDLVLYCAALPPDARSEFLAAYGPVGEAALLRARVLSIFLCATLALHARAERLPAVERESLAGLERTVRP